MLGQLVLTSATTVLSTVLVVVLGLSGFAKLGHGDQTLAAMRGFGVAPAGRGRAVAHALPVVELALAAALLVAPSGLFTVAAAATVALFAVFVALVGRVVSSGRAVDCNCFGALSAARVTASTVVRNGGLLAAAAVVLVFGRQGVIPAALHFGAPELIGYLSGCLVVSVMVIAALLASRASATRRVSARVEPSTLVRGSGDGMPWPTPDVEVTTSAGDVIALARVAVLRPTLLVLLSVECTPCRAIAAALPGWQRQLNGAVDVAVLTSEHPESFATAYSDLDVPMYYGYRALLTVTGLAGVPSALLLSPDGTVAAGPAEGLDEVMAMAEAIRQAVAASPRR